MLGSQQNFRGTVPQSNNLVGVFTHRNTKSTSKTKITKLHVVVRVNEEIGGLQITMENTTGVTEVDSSDELVSPFFDQVRAKTVVLHVGFEIVGEVLEDQAEPLALVNDIVEVDDVGMTAKFFEERDLTDGGGGNTLVFHVQTNLFDSNNILGFVIKSFVNNSVSPLAEFVKQVVALHGGVLPLGHGGVCVWWWWGGVGGKGGKSQMNRKRDGG